MTVHWVYALTQKVHQNKGETQSGEGQGKSKLKVTTVAEGNNVVCHIGGVKHEAGWAL